MLSTFTQRHCMRHGLVTLDEDGECPQCWADYCARMDAEIERQRAEMDAKERAAGRVPCHHQDCGGTTYARPGARHYPGHDPENGPSHLQRDLTP